MLARVLIYGYLGHAFYLQKIVYEFTQNLRFDDERELWTKERLLERV